MQAYKSTSQIKDRAKDLLTDRFGSALFFMLAGYVLVFLVNSFLGSLVPVKSLGSLILNLALSFAVNLFTVFINMGFAYFFLCFACGQQIGMDDLFYGFHFQKDRTLSLAFLWATVQLICFAPYNLSYFMYAAGQGSSYYYLTIILMLSGLFFYYIFYLNFLLLYYFVLDFPDLSFQEIVTKCSQKMKGNVLRMFRLQLSFIPLILLCVGSLFTGFLWLLPYMQMSYTCFYLDLMNPSSEQ